MAAIDGDRGHRASTVMSDYLRGHAIYKDAGGAWRYADNGEPTVGNERACGHCQRPNTADDHDGCLGALPGVMNACCGHGLVADAYVQLRPGIVVKGEEAVEMQKRLRAQHEGDPINHGVHQ